MEVKKLVKPKKEHDSDKRVIAYSDNNGCNNSPCNNGNCGFDW
jgi:hypothetical protein